MTVNFTVPTPGESDGTWGEEINQILELLKSGTNDALDQIGSAASTATSAASLASDASATASSALNAASAAQSAATAAEDAATDAETAAQSAADSLNDAVALLDTLSTVATSGSYTDLADTPDIPATAADVGAASQEDLDDLAGEVSTLATTKQDANSAVSTSWGVLPTIFADSPTTVPARAGAIPSGYSGAVVWDTVAYLNHPGPDGEQVAGDRWRRRTS